MSYRGSDFVCAKCFNDEGLQDFVNQYAEDTVCDFCGAESDEPLAAPLHTVTEHIAACIGTLFDDPANAGLGWEGREGGWQGTTYTTDEVFDEVELDFPKDKGGVLRAAVTKAMPTDLWSEAEPYRLNPYQQLHFSWERFCEVIKHKLRYFFAKDDFGDEEIFSPSEVLNLIFSYAERLNAFKVMPKATRLYRARYQPQDQKYASAGSLGPPPVELATQTNRMSPPGIVMTYLADDPVTALAETASEEGEFAVGEFVTERDALILDLSDLPPIPSIFAELSDSLEYDPRPHLTFLHQVSRDISRPIARDDRIHIEYVPTQVVTEYVRTALTVDKRRIDGIRYRSSRLHSRTAVVLFADRRNLILEKEEQPELYGLAKDRWLRLAAASTKVVAAPDIAKWARSARSRIKY